MTAAERAAAESGLIEPGAPLLVMLSGGADSVCLLDVASRAGARVGALHVNYGLRGEASNADEEHCRALCDRLGVPLHVERPQLPARDNLQAAARDARYAAAERTAQGDYAAAHTASDQAETVLYRLASSPGRRALLGMAPRRRRLVRPLLEATREHTRAHCRERGLEWREDASNEDPRFARARVRHELLPALRRIAPAAELTVADTSRLLADESAVLDLAADDALARLGDPPQLGDLRALPPALARLVLRRLAGDAALSRRQADAILSLDTRGTGAIDIGGGMRAVVEYGALHFAREAGAPEVPAPVELAVPGSVRFGDWRVEALASQGGDGIALDSPAIVRGWRPGDRMRPAGLGGTKTLQDLFTDRKVPRDQRATLPLVESGGEIAWVAGVAVGEGFTAHGERAVRLAAHRI